MTIDLNTVLIQDLQSLLSLACIEDEFKPHQEIELEWQPCVEKRSYRHLSFKRKPDFEKFMTASEVLLLGQRTPWYNCEIPIVRVSFFLPSRFHLYAL